MKDDDDDDDDADETESSLVIEEPPLQIDASWGDDDDETDKDKKKLNYEVCITYIKFNTLIPIQLLIYTLKFFSVLKKL